MQPIFTVILFAYTLEKWPFCSTESRQTESGCYWAKRQSPNIQIIVYTNMSNKYTDGPLVFLSVTLTADNCMCHSESNVDVLVVWRCVEASPAHMSKWAVYTTKHMSRLPDVFFAWTARLVHSDTQTKSTGTRTLIESNMILIWFVCVRTFWDVKVLFTMIMQLSHYFSSAFRPAFEWYEQLKCLLSMERDDIG